MGYQHLAKMNFLLAKSIIFFNEKALLNTLNREDSEYVDK